MNVTPFSSVLTIALALGLAFTIDVPTLKSGGSDDAESGFPSFAYAGIAVGNASYAGQGSNIKVRVDPPTVAELPDMASELFRGIRMTLSKDSHTTQVMLSTDLWTSEYILNDCPVVGDGACDPLVSVLWVQGAPSLFGGSLLAERAFMWGDSWQSQHPCAACTTAVFIEILGPAKDSPAGTEYRAKIRDAPSVSPVSTAEVMLHMGVQHGFPLRLELSTREQFDLVHLDIESPLQLEPRRERLPFVFTERHATTGGIPPEGTPMEGHPSFTEATTSAGSPPSGELVSFHYAVGRTTMSIGDVYHSSRPQPNFETRHWEDKPTDVITSWKRDRPLTFFHNHSVLDSWVRTHGAERTWWMQECDALPTIPIWRIVEHVLSLEMLHGEFTGYQYVDCMDSGQILYVRGETVTEGFGTSTQVAVDARTGLLRTAILPR